MNRLIFFGILLLCFSTCTKDDDYEKNDIDYLFGEWKVVERELSYANVSVEYFKNDTLFVSNNHHLSPGLVVGNINLIFYGNGDFNFYQETNSEFEEFCSLIDTTTKWSLRSSDLINTFIKFDLPYSKYRSVQFAKIITLTENQLVFEYRSENLLISYTLEKTVDYEPASRSSAYNPLSSTLMGLWQLYEFTDSTFYLENAVWNYDFVRTFSNDTLFSEYWITAGWPPSPVLITEKYFYKLNIDIDKGGDFSYSISWNNEHVKDIGYWFWENQNAVYFEPKTISEFPFSNLKVILGHFLDYPLEYKIDFPSKTTMRIVSVYIDYDGHRKNVVMTFKKIN